MDVAELAAKVDQLASKTDQNHQEQLRHIDEHKLRAKILAGVAATVGALLALAGTQFRDAVTAKAELRCGEAVRKELVSARAEHGKLMAADQRIAEKQNTLDRELQALAMQRLGNQEKVKPR